MKKDQNGTINNVVEFIALDRNNRMIDMIAVEAKPGQSLKELSGIALQTAVEEYGNIVESVERA